MIKIYLAAVLVVIYSTVSAQFSTAIEICVADPSMKSIHKLDFDGDGDTDLITTDGATVDLYDHPIAATMTAQTFSVCENTGGGNYVNHSLFQLGEASLWTFGDLTGDGLADFVYGEFPVWNSGNASYTIYYRENLGGYAFGPDQMVYDLVSYDTEWAWDFYYSRMAIGDTDNDGTNELVLMMNGIPGDIETYSDYENVYVLDFSTGVFSSPENLFYSPSIWGGGSNVYAGFMYDLRIFDQDGDGLNDIMLFRICGDGTELNMHKGTGSGQFETNPTNQIYTGNYDLMDTNEDGNYTFVGFDPANYSEVMFIDDNYFMSNIYEQPFDDAPGVAAIDVSGDNDFDIVACTQSGELVLFENDGTWVMNNGTWSIIPYQLFDVAISQTVGAMYRFDYNGIGGEDIVIMAEGHVYVVLNDNATDNFATIQVTPFLDDNGNELMDSGENEIDSYMFSLTPSGGIPNYYYGYSGTQTINVLPGDYELNLIDNFGALILESTTPITISLSDVTDMVTIEIPLIVDGTPVTDIAVYSYGWPGICNGTQADHYLYIYNTGSLPANGTLTYELDGVHSFISSQPAPSVVNGNTITWNLASLAPGSNTSFIVTVTPALLTDLGTFAENTVTAQLIDGMGNIEATEISESNYTVTCSYDPNDITEHNGYTDAGYILTGDELDYTIRFQNTGNAPAQNVRIENQLSERLDWSTIQPIAWSHDFQLMIDETGRAIFSFDEINLPDSVNNEAESHGFVRYRIISDTDLSFGETIESTAEIFFDLNPAVLTNTEVNTIYDCADLEQANASATEVCVGGEITFANEAIWIENLIWTYADNEVGVGELIYNVNESGIMWMQATNALCSYEESFEIVANLATATFSQNGNTLTANASAFYQWYLNDEMIADATNQTLEITESGNYRVEIIDANGCTAMSEVVPTTYTNIYEMNEVSFLVHPNPAQNEVTISAAPKNAGRRVRITDMTGHDVMISEIMNSSTIKIDISDLPNGIYTLHVGTEIKLLSVIK